MATYEVHVDWNQDSDFSDVGENISARIFDRGTAMSVRYGRDQNRVLAPLTPGQAQFELNNESRDYSPENTGSPLAGNVLPGREVRIQAVHLATTYGLLRGYLDDYEVLPDLEQRSIQVTCNDALARLKEARVSTGLYHSVRTGEAVGLLLDAVGWDPALRDLDLGASVLPWWWVDNVDAYEALLAILDSEGPGSLASVDIDGRVVFRDRHHRLTRAASTTAQATFRDGSSPAAEPCFSELVYDHGWKEIINSVGFPVQIRSVGALDEVWSMQGIQTVADGQTLEITAESSGPFTDAVTPVENTDYDVVSGAAEVTLSRTSGQSTTVRVKAVGGPATIAELKLRAHPVVGSTVQVLVEDAASIAKYGRRSWPSDREPVYASVWDAAAIAAIIMGSRAERLPAVTITLRGGVSARLTQQLARDLSDRVRIVDTGTGLDGDFWLEQIEHTIGEDHVTRFGCEKIPAQSAAVFILDSATAGVLNTNTLGQTGLDDPARIFILDSATQGVLNTSQLAH